MRELRLVTEEEFRKMDLKGPVPLDNGSLLFFNNGDAYIVKEMFYGEVAKHYYNMIHIFGPKPPMTICDVCIPNGLSLRAADKYCSLEVGLKALEGQYRVATEDDDDHNFKCTYTTPREGHTKIFR